MRPIISIVGKSESGKTTLLESLIAELKRRGYKVAVVKHSAEDVEVDTAHKDTWRFRQAGSELSAISSGHNLGIFKRLEADFSPHELPDLVSCECDIVLTEGFKRNSYPKIEVHRREQGGELVSPPQQLLAVVTDEPLAVAVPQFARDEIGRIADLIEKVIRAQPDVDVSLLINGSNVPVKPAFRDLLSRTLMAMVAGLKDVTEIESLRVSWRKRD